MPVGEGHCLTGPQQDPPLEGRFAAYKVLFIIGLLQLFNHFIKRKGGALEFSLSEFCAASPSHGLWPGVRVQGGAGFMGACCCKQPGLPAPPPPRDLPCTGRSD